jgi:hypothetical protein
MSEPVTFKPLKSLLSRPAPPAETMANVILVRDKFDGPVFTNTATSGTRNASPGPGVMTVVGSPGVSQVVTGLNSLGITRNPSRVVGNDTRVRYDGVAAAPGLTMIVRLVPGALGKPGANVPEYVGFSTSASDVVSANGGGFAIRNGGNSQIEGIDVSVRPYDGATITADTFSCADIGELMSLAVKLVSPTERTYWMQGGAMANSLGCTNYSENWMQIGHEKDTTSLANGTTLYPFLSKTQLAHGLMDVREVLVLDNWEPSKRHGLLDTISGSGVHCPTICEDPVTGLLVAAWNNGSTHENTNTKINGRVRLADKTWTALQTLVAAPGAPAIMNVGSLSIVNGGLWLTYWRNASAGGGGVLYRRAVSVNAGTGAITVGAETTISNSIPDTCLAFGHLLTIPSGSFAGRILMPVHGGSNFNAFVLRSDDDGATWTTPAAITKPSTANGWLVEPSLVMESDGAVGMYIRTAGTSAHYTRSTDGGVTWSTVVPIYNLATSGRVMAKNLPDGSIGVMSCDNIIQRRHLKLWKMGDSGVVKGSVPMGDSALSGSVGATIWQYPDFIQEGDDIFYMVSHQGSIGRTAMEYHTRQWSGDLLLAYQAVSSPVLERSAINYFPDASMFLGAAGKNCIVLTSAATVATPCRSADAFVIDMGHNITLSAPTLPLPWQRCTWVFNQPASGGPYTLTLNAIFKPGPWLVALSTAASATDYLEAIYNPHSGEWHVINFVSPNAGRSFGILTATGQTQLAASQSATDANSALSRGLGDARYLQTSLTPKFSAHKNGSNQSISATTFTKITFGTEEFDTNNNFASDRFTPTVAGKYLLNIGLRFTATERFAISIYKNGVRHRDMTDSGATYAEFHQGSVLVDANGSTDYFEVWIYAYNGSQTVNGAITSTYFQGALMP